ncbi:hypothetical protein Trydic_g14817 [Trypoxylus dichotomus]
MVSNNTNWEDDKDSYLENDVTSLRRINQAVTASSENSEEALKAILEQVKQREDAIVQWNIQKAKKDGPKKKRSCPSPVSDEEEGNNKESRNKNKKPKGRYPKTSCSDEPTPTPGPSNKDMDINPEDAEAIRYTQDWLDTESEKSEEEEDEAKLAKNTALPQ